MPIINLQFKVIIPTLGEVSLNRISAGEASELLKAINDTSISDAEFTRQTLYKHLIQPVTSQYYPYDQFIELPQQDLLILIREFIKNNSDNECNLENLQDAYKFFRKVLKDDMSKIESLTTQIGSFAGNMSKQLSPLLTAQTLGTMQDLTKSTASLATISNVAQNLTSLAEIISAPQTAIEDLSQSVKALSTIQHIAGTASWKDIATTIIGSPIVETVRDIQKVNLQSVVTTKKLEPQLIKKIVPIKEGKPDKIFNYGAYRYIFDLEVYLRKLIQTKIINPNQKQLASKIPREMLDRWAEKKKEENENVHIDVIQYDDIEYSDFSDLKIILEKKSTTTILSPLINEANIATITSKLLELNPIRIKIAHSRLLTKDELETLKIYSKKILKILPKIN